MTTKGSREALVEFQTVRHSKYQNTLSRQAVGLQSLEDSLQVEKNLSSNGENIDFCLGVGRTPDWPPDLFQAHFL